MKKKSLYKVFFWQRLFFKLQKKKSALFPLINLETV